MAAPDMRDVAEDELRPQAYAASCWAVVFIVAIIYILATLPGAVAMTAKGIKVCVVGGKPGKDECSESLLRHQIEREDKALHDRMHPPPPCQRFNGRPADRAAAGHPYSAPSPARCELGCREHLGERYAGWYGDENGYYLMSMPPQFYCHCCERDVPVVEHLYGQRAPILEDYNDSV